MKWFALIALLFFCQWSIAQDADLIQDDTTTVTGKIRVKNFVDKGGRTTDIQEAYLETKGGSYFIKFCECKATKEEIMELRNKKVTAHRILTRGHWDICEAGMYQSRVGHYVTIEWIQPYSRKKIGPTPF